ncbi:MAG: SprT-like domain-containing protein [Gemmatimonadota bacterium]|nr:SprT-like domain-containing protein [Gemmatimonadota bacterium]
MPKHDKVPLTAPRDEAALLALLRAAGLRAERVTLTRNRRVMASLGDEGRTLRVHESFLSAREPVLHALARSFVARSPRERSAARARVRSFLADRETAPSEPPPARRRPRHPLPGDEPHLLRLREEFARANAHFFDDALPEVPLHLSGRMLRRNGHFSREPLEIVVSRRLCAEGEPGEAEQTLRHEMIHLWQHATGRPVDHGAEFRRRARTLGVRPRATRAVRWRTG